jgi:hypothetical protein
VYLHASQKFLKKGSSQLLDVDIYASSSHGLSWHYGVDGVIIADECFYSLCSSDLIPLGLGKTSLLLLSGMEHQDSHMVSFLLQWGLVNN